MALTTVDAGLLNSQSQQTWRNRIINGAMVIDQRNAGAAYTPTDGSYTLDRFSGKVTQASKFTVQQVTDGPTGFVNSLKVTSSSAYTVLSSDWFYMQQIIEGYNSQDLYWGTATASPVALSFWVKSSLTGTFGGSLFSGGGGNASYPYTYTINSANTWEYKTVLVPAATIGTWLTGNSGNIWVTWGLGIGSNYTGAAGSWSSSLLRGANGCVNVVSTNAATWQITGVQLEKGSTATSFDYRPYGTELQLCQRYYYKTYGQSVVPGTASNEGRIDQASTGGTNRPVVSVRWAVPMRIPPTVTTYSPSTGASGKCRNDNSAADVNTGSYGAGETGVVWYPAATTTASDAFTVQITASSEL